MRELIERTVKIVTPACPGGADNHVPPTGPKPDYDGVRPSMIVYGMRWWFRALAGALRGTNDLPTIRAAESAIFGTAQNFELLGQQVQGLSSRVRTNVIENVDQKDYQLPNQPWFKYLAYGLYSTNAQDEWSRRFIQPGATFRFRLRIDPPRLLQRAGPDRAEIREPEIPPELVAALADLWIEFGGLGARWRHGLGSMSITARDGATVPVAEQPGINSVGAARAKINAATVLVKQFLQSLNLPDPPPAPNLPSFPVADSQHLRLAWNSNVGGTYEQALEKIHKLWRNSRLGPVVPPANRESSRNAQQYRNFREGQAPTQPLEFAGLGLPIPFGFPQLEKPFHGVVKPVAQSRRASPIWFRVIRVPDSRPGKNKPTAQFGLLAMFWDCQYLPEEEQVVLQQTGGPRKATATLVKSEASTWFDTVLKGFQREA